MAAIISRKPMTYGQLIAGSNVGVTVTTAALAEILKFIVEQQERIFCQVKNNSANAFNAFQISAKANESAAWSVLYSAAASFTAPSGILVGASGDLTTLAAGATGWFLLDTRGIYAIRVESKVAVADSTADLYFSGYGQQ